MEIRKDVEFKNINTKEVRESDIENKSATVSNTME